VKDNAKYIFQKRIFSEICKLPQEESKTFNSDDNFILIYFIYMYI
jgi:hypothetical protein